MDIIYCDRWAISKKKPWNIIEECDAKLRHEKKESYSAIVKDSNRITNIVEVTDKYISVYFLDEKLRSYLFYVFDIVKNNNVFLRTVTYYLYDDFENIKKECTMAKYEENGYIVIEQNNFITNVSTETDIIDDVSGNWDNFPNFGQYQSLCKKER